MFYRYLALTALLLTSTFAAATPSDSSVAVLSATTQDLRVQNQALTKRLKELEDKLTAVSNAVVAAQNSANVAHSASFFAALVDINAYHGGCSGVDTSSPACHAASHRYCVAQGFTSGLIVEFNGSGASVSCFR